MNDITRRSFLQKTGKGIAGAAAGAAAFSMMDPRRVLGANEKVNVALIGCGPRGNVVCRQMIEEGAVATYLCDLSEERLQESAQFVSKVQERKPELVKDMRRIFDSKDVDAVIVATPDHWHALPSIRACQAGKDVYCEKPPYHSIWEGRKMIEAARKYDRVLDMGTQNRSGEYNMAAREYIKSGKLGKICLIKVYNILGPDPLRLGSPGTPPPGFDWNEWLGAAPERPYNEKLWMKRGWQLLWDFSCGGITQDGIHQMDLCMMVLGEPGTPKSVSTSGGRFMGAGDDSEIPDVLIGAFEYDDFVLLSLNGTYPRYMRKTTTDIRRRDEFPYWTQNATRIEFYGSELLMTLGRMGGGWIVQTSGGKIVDQMYGRVPDYPHVRNFLECVKNRKRPNADVELLHQAGIITAMEAIAYRVGNKNLHWDAKAEKFLDSDEANALLKRTYRPGFEVPEEV